VGVDVGDESTESRSVVQPLCIPSMARPEPLLLLLSSDKLMSCCAVGTNGRLNLRWLAFSPGGEVSTECSRCPGYMAQWQRRSQPKNLRGPNILTLGEKQYLVQDTTSRSTKQQDMVEN